MGECRTSPRVLFGRAAAPPPFGPTPQLARRRLGLIISAVIVVVVLAMGGVFGFLYWGAQKEKADTAKAIANIQLEKVGACTHLDGLGIGMDKPLAVLDCSDPTATEKVAVSRKQATPKLACPDEQLYAWQIGTAATDFTGVESCLEPNLVVGKCYTATLHNYTYLPTCDLEGAAWAGRLAKIVPGRMDTKICNTAAPNDYAGRAAEVGLDQLDFVNHQTNSTYCFAPMR